MTGSSRCNVRVGGLWGLGSRRGQRANNPRPEDKLRFGKLVPSREYEWSPIKVPFQCLLKFQNPSPPFLAERFLEPRVFRLPNDMEPLDSGL